jgi:hypothetical protein
MERIPGTPDAIDAAWLTDALSKRYSGVRVAAVEVAERHEATNSHARLRVRYASPAGAPEWMFCKLLPSEPGRIAATGLGAREALFYERLAPSLAIRVPDAYVARHDDRDGSFVLLIEDLVHGGCRVSDGTVGVSAAAAARALEDLAQLHLRFADPARRRAEAPWVLPPLHDPGYGGAMLHHGLTHHRHRLGDAFAAVAALYIDRADALHALWQQGPTTVIHGDPHIGNLFDEAGRTGFLDWGILSTGTPLRDVSYFLAMALSIDDRRAHERVLLQHYLDVRAAGGQPAISFDDAWRTHRIHAAYTVVASCQIVTFPEKLSAGRRIFSHAFLTRAEAAVEDLETLAALRESGVTA